MPRISIIMPIYNCRAYLPVSIGSVLKQDMQDFELLCVDDGSTDGSVEYVRDMVATHGQVVRLLTGQHQGPGVARNKALDVAQGDYVMFIDADDFLEPTAMSKALESAEMYDSDVVVWDLWLYNQKFQRDQYPQQGTLNYHYFDADGPAFSWRKNPDQIFLSFQNWPWNKMFKRSFLQEHNLRFQNLHRTEDLPFTCMALVQAQRISVVYERLSHYRVGRADSAMAWKDDYPFDFFHALVELKRQLQDVGCYEQVRRSFVNWALCSALYNLESLKTYDAFVAVYDFLRLEGFDQLDIDSTMTAEYIFVEDWYNEYKLICEEEAGPFLAYRQRLLIGENEDKIGLIDKIGSELKTENALMAEKFNELTNQYNELMQRYNELDETHKEIMGASEQKIGQAICAIPRAIQRRLSKT